jgi:hypothetical protein
MPIPLGQPGEGEEQARGEAFYHKEDKAYQDFQ